MSQPETIDLSLLDGEPTYRGSVQDLFSLSVGGRDCFLCRTSDSGSVFDVGTIFSVPESDVLRTAVRHFIYTSLEDPKTWQEINEDDIKACYSRDDIVLDLLDSGLMADLKKDGMSTHHLGMVEADSGKVTAGRMPEKPSNMVLIEKFPVYRPHRFGLWNRYGWDYFDYFRADKKVIGLEHVFRLGSPGGSSLFSRFAAAQKDGPEAAEKFLQSVGLESAPVPWGDFPNMVYDCTTKYEPSDRSLSWQETIHLSGVSGEAFARVVRTLVLCTVYVSKFFRGLGFKLWDIKWECAVDGERVVVVDTIDPDSIRVTGTMEREGKKLFIHFNKQSIRDYYILCHRDWYDAINRAKKLSRTDSKGREFMEIYREGVDKAEFPPVPEVDPEFSRIQSRKYAVMVEPLMGRSTMDEARKEAGELMHKEIEYYRKSGMLDTFLDMNGG